MATAAVLVVGLTTVVDFPAAKADTPPTTRVFEQVFSANANGAVLTIGNSLLTCPKTAGSAAATICPVAQDATKPYDNNDFRMVKWDAQNEKYNDNSSVYGSSSMSELNLPDGAHVLFARLYWGARLDKGTSGSYAGDPAKANVMKFKLPGESVYTEIEGKLMAQNGGQKNAYQAYYDLTAKLQEAEGKGTLNGEYWGADVEHGNGLDRYAGWALTVAYSAPSLPLRNLTVYDGFQTVGSGVPADIKVSGFLTPAVGDVDAQLSMVAYEGDLAQTGDYTSLGGTQLATPVSPGSNFFDSVNSLAGASVTTRNPTYKNMLGFDIKNLGAPGIIPNGASEVTFSFRSAGDVYYPGVLGLAINLYAPDFTSSTKTAVNLGGPGSQANPGDTLQYTLMYGNTGQDHAKNVTACDKLPDGVKYVPGSLWLLGTADSTVYAPIKLTEDGSGVALYDEPSNTLCLNLGKGAQPYGASLEPATNGGGRIDVLEATTYQFEVVVKDEAGGTTIHNVGPLNYTTYTTGLNLTYEPPAAVTPVGLKADVKIAKDMAPAPAIAGQGGVTTLTVTNNGPNLATAVVVTDPLPDAYEATSVVWYEADSPDAKQTCATPARGGTVTCALGDMLPGKVIKVEVSGVPDSDSTATSLSNVATVATTAYDPDLTNNVDTVSIPMTHQADLKITKTDTPQTVTPGAVINWTLTVENQCNQVTAANPSGCWSDATGVVISDVVPEPTKLVLTGATGGSGAGGAEGDVAVTCPSALLKSASAQCQVVSADGAGRLKPGQKAVVKLTGYLLGNVTGNAVENTAGVTSLTFDPNQADNTTTALVTPGAANSYIVLEKTGPATAVPGGRVNYTITATNQGPSDASTVVITDDLGAAGLVVDLGTTTVTTDRGYCLTNENSVLTCTIPNLAGPSAPGGTGAKATIIITGARI
ncbi:MAG: DUF11 domain-containing protein, partial [Bifidobacteriaceae bacterium]|nr:DUF11 domain-containing protein [Bifidobacteriaceae bacterium]